MQDETINQEINTESEQVKTDTTQEKLFSQEELDRLINERIKRERKNYAQQLDDERKKATMDESERLKLEKLEAENKVKETLTQANKRIVNSEAKIIATNYGVKAEKLQYLIKLVDLSNIEIDDDGNPDTKTIKSAIDGVLKDFPELVGQTGTSRAGNDFSSGNNTPNPETMTMSEYAKWRKNNQ